MTERKPVTALYPGSFDPVTSGHVDIIERGAAIFDRLIVAVGVNPGKSSLFTVQERCAILNEVCGEYPNVTVTVIEGLLVTFAREQGARVIIRGLRAVSDFEYEFQQALMNSHMEPTVETLFLMTRHEHLYLSSSLIKNIAALGGPVTGLVPPAVERRLASKLASLPVQIPATQTAE